jgi:hypothetical protein
MRIMSLSIGWGEIVVGVAINKDGIAHGPLYGPELLDDVYAEAN